MSEEASILDPQFNQLMARLQNGEPEAAKEVFNRFWVPLLHLAAQQFETWMRERADPEGIVQSALWSFFKRARNGKIIPDGWEETAAVLAVITFRKCSNRRKFLLADKRDARRERPEASDGQGSIDHPHGATAEPNEAILFQELLESLLQGFEERERQIVALSLEGFTHHEISQKLDRPARAVRRVLEKVKERMRRLREKEGF